MTFVTAGVVIEGKKFPRVMHNHKQGYFIGDDTSSTLYLHFHGNKAYKVHGRPVYVHQTGKKRELLVLAFQEFEGIPEDRGLLKDVAIQASQYYNKTKRLEYKPAWKSVHLIPQKQFERAKKQILPNEILELLKKSDNDVPNMNGFQIFDNLEFIIGLDMPEKEHKNIHRRSNLTRVVYAPCIWSPAPIFGDFAITTNAPISPSKF